MTEKPETYRKKPVTVKAIKWTGDNLRDVINFTGRHPSARNWSWDRFDEAVRLRGLKIFTAEGPLIASVGDFIIKGVLGEVYPCKPDIFEMTYEMVIE